MKQLKRCIGIGCAILISINSAASAQEISVHTPEGDAFLLEVDSTDDLNGIKELVAEVTGAPVDQLALLLNGEILADGADDADMVYKIALAQDESEKGPSRSFQRGFTAQDSKDVHYIVTNMSKHRYLAGLAFIAGELRSAGDRIESVHPLRFLQVIFTNEDTKNAIYSIKAVGGGIAHEFFTPFYATLSEEYDRKNMKDAFVKEFAQKVGVNHLKLFPYLSRKDWNGLVQYLIDTIPRQGNQALFEM